MSIRPSGIPIWSTAGSGIVEPTDAKKALGWGATGASGERPPAEYFNWMQNLNGAWLRYLSYERLVDDDFVSAQYGFVAPAGVGVTSYPGSHQGLSVAGPAGAWSYSEDPNASTPSGWVGVGGYLRFNPQASGFYFASYPLIGRLGNMDHFFRSSVARELPIGVSGCTVALGLVDVGAGTVPTGVAFFRATGASSPWSFFYHGNESQFSIMPTLRAASGCQRLEFERVGATLHVEIACPVAGVQAIAIAATGIFGPIRSDVGISANPKGAAPNDVDWFFDYLKFGVRR